MSKIIESLKESAKEFSKKQPAYSEVPLEGKKSGYEMTQEQLADIYFGGSDKTKKSEYPMVVKVVEKARPASFLPWLIASIAFLITAFSLFSTKKIFVDIRVIDEKNPYIAMMQNPMVPVFPQGMPAEGGEKIATAGFAFEGAASLKSSKDGVGLTLVNSSLALFARASQLFDSPLDLSKSKIVFYAKGAKGGENIAVAFRDRGNVLAFEEGSVYPFPAKLTTEWQKGEVAFQNLAEGFSAKHVASMRFEFGARTAKNRPGDTIFVRDVRIVPV